MEEDISHHDELGGESLTFGLLYHLAQAKTPANIIVFGQKGDSVGTVKVSTTFEAAPPQPAPTAAPSTSL